MSGIDTHTFETLVRQHHAAVYRSARRVLRDDARAEDVAQDVFLRVLTGKFEVPGDGSAAALCWLSTRLALNALRGVRRRETQEQRAAMPEPSATPFDHAESRELRHEVRRLVDELPDDLRLPLVLRYQDGLTFAAVGSALGVAESTAHERVQQALQRLRALLGRLGLGVAPVALLDLVAGAETAPPPTGLEARLLGLGAVRAAAVPLAAKLGLAALLVGGITAIALVPSWSGSGPASVAQTPPASASDPLQPPPAAAAAERSALAQDAPTRPASPVQPAAQRGHVTMRGSVHDAEGWPVGEARVVAVAGGGLKPFEIAATTTRVTGEFELAVPLDAWPVTPRQIRLQVHEGGQRLLETGELPLRAPQPGEGEPEPMRLRLEAGAGTKTSRFVLEVTVRGDDGRPLDGVPIALYTWSDPPPYPGGSRAEVEARSGAGGIAKLAGRTPGKKLLFADGRKLGLSTAVETVTIERPGDQRAALSLARGQTIVARIATIDGQKPEWASIWIEEDATRVRHVANLGTDGQVTFQGIGAGPCALHVRVRDYSPVELRGLKAGDRPVEVKLKRADDERDVGHHMAELHGRLVDAATGAVVPYVDDGVEVLPVRPGSSTLAIERVEPPRPVQRMVSEREETAFHLTGLAAGQWAIVARVPGYAKTVRIVELREGELQRGLDLALHRGARVAGRLVDAAGKPVTKALVFAAGFGDQASASVAARDGAAQKSERLPGGGMLACSARARDDGTFVLEGVPPGASLRIVAVAKGHALAQSEAMTLRDGEQRDGLELRLGAR